MERNDYLKMLVEEMHSTTMATIGADGHPQTRVIDMMLWDKKGVYFLTAKGKAFYAQLMEQGYVAISATKDKKAVSLRGRIQNIHSEKLDEIFGKNPYMQKIYPGDTRAALEVFRVYEVGNECIGCKLCFSVCPQKCIDITRIPAVIDQHQCLHCGRCAETCPRGTIRKRGQ